MQEELKNVLALFRDRRKHLEIHKTPDVFITQTSNPAEIEKWLRAKGFEERTVKKLNGLSGNELFGLKKHTLEDYFGIEEGRRLASQITIQKNVSGVSFASLKRKFASFKQKFASLKQKFASLKQKFASLKRKFTSLIFFLLISSTRQQDHQN